jgi:hypothetical protein
LALALLGAVTTVTARCAFAAIAVT